MVKHGTIVKIIANHDTWNACQDLDKIAIVYQDSYQGCHVKNSMKTIFS